MKIGKVAAREVGLRVVVIECVGDDVVGEARDLEDLTKLKARCGVSA